MSVSSRTPERIERDLDRVREKVCMGKICLDFGDTIREKKPKVEVTDYFCKVELAFVKLLVVHSSFSKCGFNTPLHSQRDCRTNL